MYRELKDALLSIAQKAIDALLEADASIELSILHRHLEKAIKKNQSRKKRG